MGIGPVYAVPKLLKRHGLRVEDIDVWELNEAFASQVIYCRDKLGLDPAKLNKNGGSISIGHPFGMTGSRMVGTIANEMLKSKARYGVVTMCIGGGQGAAGLFEACNWLMPRPIAHPASATARRGAERSMGARRGPHDDMTQAERAARSALRRRAGGCGGTGDGAARCAQWRRPVRSAHEIVCHCADSNHTPRSGSAPSSPPPTRCSWAPTRRPGRGRSTITRIRSTRR
jgi:hypothetical protein